MGNNVFNVNVVCGNETSYDYDIDEAVLKKIIISKDWRSLDRDADKNINNEVRHYYGIDIFNKANNKEYTLILDEKINDVEWEKLKTDLNIK